MHRAQRGARRRLADGRHRRDAEPLLRLGPAGGELRRDGRHVRPAGARGRRRRREHVARADGLRRRGLDGHNRHLREMSSVVPQGISADLIATLEGFSRDDVDRFALASQQKARAAIEEGRFAKSLVPVEDRDGQGRCSTATSTRARETTLEALGKLEPAFVGMGATRMRAARRTLRRARRASATRRSRRSTTCTPPATRAASSTARRRCCSRRADYAQGARAQAARAHPRDGDPRRRAGHHADRAGAGLRALPEEGRDDGRATSTSGRSTRPSRRAAQGIARPAASIRSAST